MSSPVRLVLPFVVAIVAFPRGAQADACGEAEVIFREGLAKREAHDYEGALPLLHQSLALCRSPGLGALYNIALAEQGLTRIAAAYLHYAEFLRDVRPVKGLIDVRIDDAKKAMADLRAAGIPLHLVHLDKLPPGATVTVDDAPVGVFTKDYEIPAELGPHTIVIRAAGSSERRLSVEVRRGEPLEVNVLSPPPLPPWRTVGFVVGGVGIAGLAAGVITGSLALRAHSQLCHVRENPCTSLDSRNNQLNTGKTLGNASTGTFIAGGVLTAVGATLVVLSSKTQSKENDLPRQTAVVPLCLPGGGGLLFTTTF